MLADAMLDVERCRIDDKTAPQTKGSRLRAQFDTCFFSRSCRMIDLGDRGPTRATRVDIDRWTRVKAQLRAELGEKVFSSWFGRMELDRIHDTTVHLTVPTTFLKGWIQTHYADRLLAC